ncbi:MAG: acyltransferase family protein [Acidimicrobiia bacterium]
MEDRRSSEARPYVETHPSVTSATRPTLRYLPGLDGLRAVSVLAVMAFHAGVTRVTGGFLGVEVFFVISGYLITSLLLAERRRAGRVSLRNFWIRRGRRLLPALWVMLAVVVAFTVLFLPDAVGALRRDVVGALTYTSNWVQIFGHVSYFEQAGRPPLLQHLWSLAIEEQFYLIWPPVLLTALFFLGRARTAMVVAFVTVGGWLWAMLLYSPSTSRAYYGTDTRAAGLLVGALLAFVWVPGQFQRRAARSARYVLNFVGAGALIVLLWSFHRATGFDPADAWVFRGGLVVVDVMTVLVIAAIVHPAADLNFLLGAGPLRWIGQRSYGLYLWHWPIFQVTRPGVDVPFAWFPTLVLRLVLTLGAAELSYRYVEVPIRSGAVGRLAARTRSGAHSREWRAVWHGLGVAVGVCAVVTVLALGLAGATPRTERVYGIAESAHGHDRGDRPDASIVALARRVASSTSASTTTAVTTTSTTTAAPAVPGPDTTAGTLTAAPVSVAASPPVTPPATAAPPPQPPPTTAPPPKTVMGIGDSVMLGARSGLEGAIPGMLVDAKVSRQFGDALQVLTFYRDANLLPEALVVHLGTNGAFTDAQFEQMMQIIGNRPVWFLSVREPRAWQQLVNDRLKAGVGRWPNAHLIDWFCYAGSHGDWFAADGFHVGAAGARAYGDLVKSFVIGPAPLPIPAC